MPIRMPIHYHPIGLLNRPPRACLGGARGLWLLGDTPAQEPGAREKWRESLPLLSWNPLTALLDRAVGDDYGARGVGALELMIV